MDWADSLGAFCACSTNGGQRLGFEYGIEKAAKRVNTISGRPLRRDHDDRQAQSPQIRPASVVALGFEDFRTFSSGSILLDAFEAGGNLFDTAYIYGGGGYAETLLGEWLANRGVREQSVIIGKGAHTPLCYPDVIGKQLTQSLDRLQTTACRHLLMHQNNVDVPVSNSSTRWNSGR